MRIYPYAQTHAAGQEMAFVMMAGLLYLTKSIPSWNSIDHMHHGMQPEELKGEPNSLLVRIPYFVI